MCLIDILRLVPNYETVDVWKGSNKIASYRSDIYGSLQSDIPTDLDNETVDAIYATGDVLSIALRDRNPYIR